MKLSRKERRQNWKLSWKTENFIGENRKAQREEWYQSWNKFKV